MSNYTEEQAKSDADALIARLENDPELRKALDEDPHRALVAAGFPEDVVAEVDQALAGGEVEGFMLNSGPNIALGPASLQLTRLFPQMPGGGGGGGGGCAGQITTPTGTGNGGVPRSRPKPAAP